jgi:D-alanine-D-alanine ligase
MKVSVIYNKKEFDESDVISRFGLINKEAYNPETVEKVAAALEKGGHNVRIIEGNKNVIETLQEFMPQVVAGRVPGMVFNMAYGIQGRSRYTHIPALLEMMGIPYVGSGPAGHAVALDKVMSKMIFQKNNLPTPEYRVVSTREDDFLDVDFFPVIVKPRNEAVSMGMVVAYDTKTLKDAVLDMLEEGRQVFIEQFIPGREFAVGVLGNDSYMETLPIVEIDLQGDPNAIQSHDDKTLTPRGKICPANIDDKLAEQLRHFTKASFNALGLHDFARVDFRVSESGEIYILEINSMASLGPTGSYVFAAKTAGYNYTTLVNRMLEVAAMRYFGPEFQNDKPQEQKENGPAKKQNLNTRIRSFIRSQMPTFVDFLKHSSEINTNVFNSDGVNSYGKLLTERLGNLGFTCQAFPQTEVGNFLYFKNHFHEVNDILLVIHLDSALDYTSYSAFNIDKGRIKGSGAAGQKGGITLMAAALHSLKFTKVLSKIKIGIFAATDETIGGRFSKKILREISANSKIAAGMNTTGKNGAIIKSAPGEMHYIAEYNSTEKTQGNENELVEILTKKVAALLKLSNTGNGTAIYISEIKSNSYSDSRTDHAMLKIAANYRLPSEKEELDKKIRETATRNIRGKINSSIRRQMSRDPLFREQKNGTLFEMVKKMADELEVIISEGKSTRSSNICNTEDIPALDGFGPIGGDFGTGNEFILRDSIMDRAVLLAKLIYESREK